MAAPRVPVAIALGSNLGNREAHLAFALSRLQSLLHNVRASTFVETPAEGVPGDQPPFLNGAVVGETDLSPQGLLAALGAIEVAAGRTRPYWYAARTLDLDLILYGNAVVEEEGLVVPHPRFRERRFVLAPLAEVAGGWIDPVTGQTVSALLRRLPPSPS